MKKRKLKVLYILLTVTLAFLIALTGMFVPKLLLNTKAKKLATATGEWIMEMYRHIPIRWIQRPGLPE